MRSGPMWGCAWPISATRRSHDAERRGHRGGIRRRPGASGRRFRPRRGRGARAAWAQRHGQDDDGARAVRSVAAESGAHRIRRRLPRRPAALCDRAGGSRPRGRGTLTEVFRLFPRLAELRRQYGDQLSGGEQQMLAIGRALMTNPKLIVLDEATGGLAPLIRVEIWDRLKRLSTEGQSILVIDKNLKALLGFVDRIAVIEKGRIVWRGSAGEFRSEPSIVERFLHVGGAPAPAATT